MSTPSPESPRSLYRWPIRVLAILIIALIVYRSQVNTLPPGGVSPSAELRKYKIVPPFMLTERSGRNITNNDLRGKIWVADFIYTTCPGPCPLVTAQMAKLQDAVAKDPQVQLVTFTVDPVTDTPPILAAYADKFGADPNRWWFLTGPEKPLYELIQDGFLQSVVDNRGQPPQEGQFTVSHSTRLVLVDGDGTVRGFYDGINNDGLADLRRDIKILETEANP